MASAVFYAHEVENGIKIGYTSNYEKRRAQYESSGQRCKLIRICRYASRGLDSSLKDALSEYLIKEPTYDFIIKEKEEKKPCGRETYDISIRQLNLIFDYIEENKDIIKKDLIHIIKKAESSSRILFMRLKKIKSKWHDGIYRHYTHNRLPDDIRVNNIKNYIESNYNKAEFILPNLIFVTDPDDKNKLILIDGQHRMNAILSIEMPDILDTKIPIFVDTSATNEDDILRKFITINRAVSVQTFSFTTAQMNKNILGIKRGFTRKFGKLLTYTKQLGYKVDLGDISNVFNTNEALTKLYSYYNCGFIPTIENCLDLLFRLNKLLCDSQKDLDSEDFTKFINELRNTGRKKVMEKTINKYIDAAKSFACDESKELCLLGFLNNADIFKIITENVNINEEDNTEDCEIEDDNKEDCEIGEDNAEIKKDHDAGSYVEKDHISELNTSYHNQNIISIKPCKKNIKNVEKDEELD